MDLQQIRNALPDLDEVVPVDREFVWNGVTSYAAAWIRKEETICLFVLSRITEEDKDVRRKRERLERKRRNGPPTVREVMLSHFSERDMPGTGRTIRVNGKEYGIASTSSGDTGEWDTETVLTLAELMRRGVELNFLPELPMSGMRVTAMELEGGFQRIPEEWTLKPVIEWEPDPSHRSRLLKKRLLLPSGKQDTKIRFRDETGQTHLLYVSELSYYDIWEKEEHRFEDPKYVEKFPAEQLEEMKRTFFDSLTESYPRGTRIPIVEYETEGGIQAQFYSKEELDQPEKVHIGSCSSMWFLFRPDEPEGIHGGRRYCCALGGRSDEPEELAVELLFVRIPEKSETVRIV